MTQGDNAGSNSNWGEKKMEGEDSVRTVDCLRGRLLAERLASRNAKEEAEQLGNKLIELENQLKQEAKSRNRAEKRLKLLFKKLQSMNISYVSDESEYSGLVDKSDISSLSSTTTSSSIKEKNDNQQKSQKGSESLHPKNDSQNCLFIASDDNSSTIEGSLSSTVDGNLNEIKGQDCEMGQNEVSLNLEHNIAQNSIVEKFSFSDGDANSEKSSHVGSNQDYNDSKINDQSDICYNSFRFSTEDDGLINKEDDQVDNSMALVVVDMPSENRTIDPEVLDSTVKEVLDALRHAKEQLQSSIERRRMNMIRVG